MDLNRAFSTAHLRRSPLVLAVLGVLALSLIAQPASAPASTYRVRPGDTLSGIAAAHRLTLRSLARLNALDPNGVLLAGTVLRLPSPHRALMRYRVRAGDSLSAIAVRYGTSVQVIARLNRLDPDALLPVGRTLVLPERKSERSAIRRSILHWARHYGVRQKLALAVAWQESGHQPNLTSAAGAWGVMQVMPTTWAYVETTLIGRPIPHTTKGGIRVGVAYLHHLLNAFRSNERLALAAYLQGEASVREHGVFPSSESYVANILALAR
jgi:soluble lytic murein transglycosylase-like protein